MLNEQCVRCGEHGMLPARSCLPDTAPNQGGMYEAWWSCGGQCTPSRGHDGGSGAGCARYVGYRCPGISTDRSAACSTAST